uniref:Uncharacterized protein n=1 Tax=Romanomermis culicivorax TaxID=13658 RepID=A0A915J1I8_ROMCU
MHLIACVTNILVCNEEDFGDATKIFLSACPTSLKPHKKAHIRVQLSMIDRDLYVIWSAKEFTFTQAENSKGPQNDFAKMIKKNFDFRPDDLNSLYAASVERT